MYNWPTSTFSEYWLYLFAGMWGFIQVFFAWKESRTVDGRDEEGFRN